MNHFTVFDKKELVNYGSRYAKTGSGKSSLDNTLSHNKKDYVDEDIRNNQYFTPFGYGFITNIILNHYISRLLIMLFCFPLLPLIIILEDIYLQHKISDNSYWVYKWRIYALMLITAIIVSPFFWYICSLFVKDMIIVLFPLTGMLWLGIIILFRYFDVNFETINQYSKDYNYYYLIDYKKENVSKRGRKIFFIPLLIVLATICVNFIFYFISVIYDFFGISFDLKELEYAFFTFSLFQNLVVISIITIIGYDIYEQKKLKRDVSVGFWDKRVKYYIFFGFFLVIFLAIITGLN